VHTYGQAAAKCVSLGKQLCDKACANTGCAYNVHPVFTRLSCTPATPPPPPSPTPTLPAIPLDGVQVIDGKSGAFVQCLMPGDEATTSATFGRRTIALQCCDSDGTCRRHLGSNDNDPATGCLARKSSAPAPYITVHTYGQAAAKCASLGKQLCDKTCRGSGCRYDSHPVYTRLPCVAPPPQSPPPLALQPPPPSPSSALSLRRTALDFSSTYSNDAWSTDPRLDGQGAWCAGIGATNAWMRWTFDDVYTIVKIETRGNRINNCCYTKSYRLVYSTDGVQWTEHPSTMQGNTAAYDSAASVQSIAPFFDARYVEVRPITWEAVSCMRVELYGHLNVSLKA